MKKSLILVCLGSLFLTVSCSNHKEEDGSETPLTAVDTSLQYFGDSITLDGAVPSEQLLAKIAGKDSINIKLSGTIEEVCQKKGCWMNMNIGNGQSMKVRFKDYGFFVPKDAAGKTVIMEGFAFNDTISVADLQHYAEDAGKTKEEIAKITEPEMSISFESHGLILKK
jgi:hypothetical protein